MKKNLPILTIVFLFAFTFSGCNLLQNPASKDASTQVPVIQDKSSTPVEANPEKESINSAQSDQELLELLENMDEPSFGDDLNTLESSLR